jgi:hypothetical protein
MNKKAKPPTLKERLALELAEAVHESIRRQASSYVSEVDLRADELESFFLGLGDESDRAVAIVVYSYMDRRLQELLQSGFNEGIHGGASALFGPTGPLGSSYARIQLAGALYWLKPATYANLHLFRKIRNAFAHSSTMCSLEDSPFAEYIGTQEPLEAPMLAARPEAFLTTDELGTRGLFIVRAAVTCAHAIIELATAPVAQRLGLDPHEPLRGGAKNLPRSVDAILDAAAGVLVELAARDTYLAYAADELGCHADCTAGCRPRRTRRAILNARG